MLRTQLFFVFFLVSLVWVSGDEKNHKFADNEVIPLYANNVGPHWNPSETYSYYKLPFCAPADAKEKSPRLGQKLEGDRYVLSTYQLRFKDDMTDQALCTKELSAEDVNTFIKAVKQKYYFEMRFDTLPIFGLVGSIEPHDETSVAPENIHYFLNTNLHFHAEYNGDRVIQINVTSDKFIELRENEPASVSFTYSVSWNPTDYPFKKRMDKYKNPFLPQELEIHWLSIMNSFVLVILLTGFLAIIIMRVLKSDYARYARTEDEEEDQEDYGWKLVHGDVFRFPPHKNLFTALLGIGSQFLSMMVCILLLAVGGLFYPHNPGNLYTAAIVLYAFCAGIGGFVSGRMYKQMNGDRWAWNIVLTATLFVVPFVLAVTYVNSVARHYKVSAALPFLAILEVLSIWLFVGFPLTVFGGIGGRRMAGQFEAPCRTKNFPREIPPIPWYRQLPFQMMMAGFLPFSAIYIELFYIYSSVWGHSSYTLYGILMLVFIILNVVTACITVALTYFQLSMEDHRWWWTSFINGGSTAIFIYAYSIFYYIYRSEMTGLIQGSFYFTYMLVVCFFFFLLLGSVGFFSSLIFVRRIYKNVKSD